MRDDSIHYTESHGGLPEDEYPALRRCPMCGSYDVEYMIKYPPRNFRMHVECRSCRLRTEEVIGDADEYEKMKEYIAAKWNQRTADTKEEQKNEQNIFHK